MNNNLILKLVVKHLISTFGENNIYRNGEWVGLRNKYKNKDLFKMMIGMRIICKDLWKLLTPAFIEYYDDEYSDFTFYSICKLPVLINNAHMEHLPCYLSEFMRYLYGGPMTNTVSFSYNEATRLVLKAYSTKTDRRCISCDTPYILFQDQKYKMWACINKKCINKFNNSKKETKSKNNIKKVFSVLLFKEFEKLLEHKLLEKEFNNDKKYIKYYFGEKLVPRKYIRLGLGDVTEEQKIIAKQFFEENFNDDNLKAFIGLDNYHDLKLYPFWRKKKYNNRTRIMNHYKNSIKDNFLLDDIYKNDIIKYFAPVFDNILHDPSNVISVPTCIKLFFDKHYDKNEKPFWYTDNRWTVCKLRTTFPTSKMTLEIYKILDNIKVNEIMAAYYYDFIKLSKITPLYDKMNCGIPPFVADLYYCCFKSYIGNNKDVHKLDYPWYIKDIVPRNSNVNKLFGFN